MHLQLRQSLSGVSVSIRTSHTNTRKLTCKLRCVSQETQRIHRSDPGSVQAGGPEAALPAASLGLALLALRTGTALSQGLRHRAPVLGSNRARTPCPTRPEPHGEPGVHSRIQEERHGSHRFTAAVKSMLFKRT